MSDIRNLQTRFTQVMPLADGIWTGIYYLCPNDPRRKRAHAVLFDEPIIPPEYLAAFADCRAMVLAGLDQSAEWRAQPKWHRIGDGLSTLTLSPSIARSCCHITITNGRWAP